MKKFLKKNLNFGAYTFRKKIFKLTIWLICFWGKIITFLELVLKRLYIYILKFYRNIDLKLW